MTIFYVILAIIPIVSLAALFARSIKQKSKGISNKKIVLSNLVGFALVFVTIGVVTFSVSAATSDATPATDTSTSASEQAETSSTGDLGKGLGLIAAALVTGISGVGGGIAVAAGAPAAIAATSEDPKAFGKSLIFVALGESIALYGVVISILIINKI